MKPIFERRVRRTKIKENGISGFATNDSWYTIKYRSDDISCFNKIIRCKYYNKWINIIDNIHNNPNLTLFEGWKKFSVFLKWLEAEEIKTGITIDNPLMVLNTNFGSFLTNEISPDSTILISYKLSKFMNNYGSPSLYSPNVTWSSSYKRFRSNISLDGKGILIGDSLSLKEAYLDGVLKKEEITKNILSKVKDERTLKIVKNYINFTTKMLVPYKVITFTPGKDSIYLSSTIGKINNYIKDKIVDPVYKQLLDKTQLKECIKNDDIYLSDINIHNHKGYGWVVKIELSKKV